MSKKKIEVKELDLNDILPNRFQPRIKFNEELITELSESIKEHGVIQPIIVRPIDDKYEIVAGERRFKASALAGLTMIPSIILDLEDKDSIEYALLENVQREDLSAIEEAITYKKILDMGYITQVQLAQKLGKSQSAIANKLRLLKLCDEVQEALMERKISERHARSLLKIESYNHQKELLYKIIKEKMTVRQLDKVISETPEIVEDENNEEIKQKDIHSDSNKTNLNERLSNESIDKNKEMQKDENTESVDSNSLIKLSDTKNNVEEIKDNSTNSKFEEDKEKEILENNGELSENVIDLSDFLSDLFKTDNHPIEVDDGQQKITEKEIENNKKEVNDNMFNNESNDDTVQSGGKFFNANLVKEQEENNDLNISNNAQSSSSIFGLASGKVNSTNNNSNIFTAKMNDLLSPQSSINTINNNDNEKIDDSTNSTTEIDNSNSSMFSNLLNKEENESSSNNYFDKNTLDKFLDPTFVDGEKKEENSNVSQLDNPIFSRLTEDSNIEKKDLNELNNSDENLENSQKSIESFQKPDLLAPMEKNYNFNSDLLNNKKEEVTNLKNNDQVSVVSNSDINNKLTPDVTLNEEEKTDETNNNLISETSEESNIQPIFVNSSFNSDELSIPKTPIITNTEMSNLLSKPVVEEETTEEKTEEEIPSTIAETANIPTTNNNFMTSDDIQPIIITDYNKQYDPILPVSNTIAAPTIDFKHILNLIRNLNNEIEGYGYKIETEEIDLDDKYQVIFNIEKNQ